MSDISSIPLLALIQERGLVDDLQLEEVAQEHTRSGKPVIQTLQDFGLLDLETVLAQDPQSGETVRLKVADLQPVRPQAEIPLLTDAVELAQVPDGAWAIARQRFAARNWGSSRRSKSQPRPATMPSNPGLRPFRIM